jgi:dTMP kinase
MTASYVALEGIEGAGKSTIAGLVASHLRSEGSEVVLVREPGGTELGEEIRRLLLHSGEMSPWAEAALFAASRAQLVDEVVRPALERGALVISDRTYYSSLAYQGHARGLGVVEVRAINEAVLGGTLPDLVVVLEVDPGVGLDRQIEADRIGGAGLGFQRQVAEGYRLLAEQEPAVVRLVPAGDAPERVAAAVVELIGSW